MSSTVEAAAPEQVAGTEFIRARPLLGTLVEMTVGGLAQAAAYEAIERAFAEVERIHALMSFQSPDSEVTRLNSHAFQGPVTVSLPTWEVLQAAQALAQASDGLFDITVASSLMQLGYLPCHASFTSEALEGNWRDIQLLTGQRVYFARPLCIDLSGIAKGYAVDRATQVLQEGGAHSACVNAGGDLRCFGTKRQSIHVRHPAFPSLTLPLLELAQGAVATSAHYFARRQHEGRMVSPLIHPDRRDALTEDISATVLADTCMLADALTKVVHADAQRASGVLAHFDADALLLRFDPASGNCMVFDTRARHDVPAEFVS